MGNLLSRITDLITKAGPPVKQELVFTGTKGEDTYEELGTFSFKRLTFSEMDGLRLHSINPKGQFDVNLHKGNNARMVAATLVDDDSGIPQFSAEDVETWPGYIVDAFAASANRANSNTVTAAKEVAKNSEETVSVAP